MIFYLVLDAAVRYVAVGRRPPQVCHPRVWASARRALSAHNQPATVQELASYDGLSALSTLAALVPSHSSTHGTLHVRLSGRPSAASSLPQRPDVHPTHTSHPLRSGSEHKGYG